MTGRLFDFDPPDRFVAGTMGEPGSRTYYLQATGGSRVTTVRLEREQLSVLAERVDELLDELLRRGHVVAPAQAAENSLDDGPLTSPVVEEFRVGAMSLAWDTEDEHVVIECYSEDTDIPVGTASFSAQNLPTGEVLRVTLDGRAARAFARRAQTVVTEGRTPCPFCGNPLDPSEGHICPRSNGFRR